MQTYSEFIKRIPVRESKKFQAVYNYLYENQNKIIVLYRRNLPFKMSFSIFQKHINFIAENDHSMSIERGNGFYKVIFWENYKQEVE